MMFDLLHSCAWLQHICGMGTKLPGDDVEKIRTIVCSVLARLPLHHSAALF